MIDFVNSSRELAAINYERQADRLMATGDKHLEHGRNELALSCFNGAACLRQKAEDVRGEPLFLTEKGRAMIDCASSGK